MSVKTMPPNQMVTVARQIQLNERHGRAPPERDVGGIIRAKSRRLLHDGCTAGGARHRLGIGATWDTPWIATASVDLVVTSPPFADVVDYGHETWMHRWFAGMATEDIGFSHLKSLTDWREMIRRTLVELMRVVRPGGYIALEVGEIRRGTVNLEQHVWRAAEGLPCARLGVVVHNGAVTKSARIYGVENGTGGTNSNRIILLQRL